MRRAPVDPNERTQVQGLSAPSTRIDTKIERPAVRDGLDDLIDFHDEIRRALNTLERVAAGDVADAGDIEDLRDFLTGPLTWHDEDEEVSLLARLRRRRVWSEHLTHVAAGHEKLEDLLDELVPLLDRLPDSRAALRDGAPTLRALLTGHMKLEEDFLFPLVRKTFDDDAIADMGAEIRSRHQRRRAQQSGTAPTIPPSAGLRALPDP